MKRLAVIGMGRSGTSFLASFLARSGVYFDDVKLADKGKFRKAEHRGAREINDAILKERFAADANPPYGNLPADEIVLEEPWPSRAAAFVAQLDERAAAVDPAPAYWGVKDPRITVLHSAWLDKFDVLVGIFRDPLDVVESYLAQNWVHGDDPRGTALAFWTRFNQSLLAIPAIYPDKPLHVVDFNADVPAQLETLCNRLELPRVEAAFDLYQESRQRGSRFLQPLRRARMPREAKETYERLRGLRNL
jgi:hypothetical protein